MFFKFVGVGNKKKVSELRKNLKLKFKISNKLKNDKMNTFKKMRSRATGDTTFFPSTIIRYAIEGYSCWLDSKTKKENKLRKK